MNNYINNLKLLLAESLSVCCLLQKLDLVNGVLFTGGFRKKGMYYSVAEKIFKVT